MVYTNNFGQTRLGIRFVSQVVNAVDADATAFIAAAGITNLTHQCRSWSTTVVVNIINDDIIITKNSIYAIHDVSKMRDKKLKDLGI